MASETSTALYSFWRPAWPGVHTLSTWYTIRRIQDLEVSGPAGESVIHGSKHMEPIDQQPSELLWRHFK